MSNMTIKRTPVEGDVIRTKMGGDQLWEVDEVRRVGGNPKGHIYWISCVSLTTGLVNVFKRSEVEVLSASFTKAARVFVATTQEA